MLTPKFLVSRGGIATALAGLLPALREQGVQTDLVALSPRGENPEESPLWGPHLHLVRPFDPFFGYSPELRPLMEEHALHSNVVHSHGLWFYLNYMAYCVKWMSRTSFRFKA